MILILTAKTKDGMQIILSSKMKKEQLREWQKSRTFFCPQCEKKVHLKVGDIVIPHFAHKKNSSCSAKFSEGESKEHLKGKQQLFAFFQRNHIDVELEPYFTELAQRPDLLITYQKKLVPIEFQCSIIPVSQIESRTAGYKNAGMNPTWLLATPRKLKTLPQGVGVFHISRFEQSFFIPQFPEGWIFLTYDPHFERFHYFSSLLHVTGNQYIGIHRTLPISKQIFPFARPNNPVAKEIQRYVWLYLSKRKQYLQSRVLLNRRGVNDPFLRRCYELKILPVELPFWIGVPVQAMNAFRIHACEWQLALVYFMGERRIAVSNLSKGMIQHFVKQFDGDIDRQVKACLHYRDFLIDRSINSFEEGANFDKKDLLKYFADTLLAK